MLFASSAPFSVGDLIGILAFAVDLALAPLSAVLVLLAYFSRGSSRPWAIVLGITAGLNMTVASVMVALSDGGLGAFIWLGVLQVVLASALLAIVVRPGWRRGVFARD